MALFRECSLSLISTYSVLSTSDADAWPRHSSPNA